MRPVRLLAMVSLVAAPASAEPLQIHGTTGYLGEYELVGSVSEHETNGTKELSGPLTVKHVGLCTHDGPQETTGEIRFAFVNASRVIATLDVDGMTCSFKGTLAEPYEGAMDCGHEGSFPLRLWTK